MEKEEELVQMRRVHKCHVLPPYTWRRTGKEVEGSGGQGSSGKGVEVQGGGAGRQEIVFNSVQRPRAGPLQECKLSGVHHRRSWPMWQTKLHIRHYVQDMPGVRTLHNASQRV